LFVGDSVGLAFGRANETGRFELYQDLADWILWSMTFAPEHHSGFEPLVFDVGRRSYEACWRILRGKWEVYSELAEEFPRIVGVSRKNLLSIKNCPM
jgi:hypothetical protein